MEVPESSDPTIPWTPAKTAAGESAEPPAIDLGGKTKLAVQ
jgi:hypothetical protein